MGVTGLPATMGRSVTTGLTNTNIGTGTGNRGRYATAADIF
jgi:hypothetical protein